MLCSKQALVRKPVQFFAQRALTIVANPATQSMLGSKVVKGKDIFVDKTSGEVFTPSQYHHPFFSKDEMEHIQVSHRKVRKFTDGLAYYLVRTLRRGFDLVSGYKHPKYEIAADGSKKLIGEYHIAPQTWLTRFIFLESIAGVPGLVGGFLRHLHSLRLMKRDKAWIESLCEEAYNEKMHLMIFTAIGKPGWFLKTLLWSAQGVFTNLFFLTYLISPKSCHRFVGYLEEEAVITYSSFIEDLDNGHLDSMLKLEIPDVALSYYNLPKDANFRDLILYVRADEAKHREVNHTLANLNQKNDRNPFAFAVSEDLPQPVNGLKFHKPEGWERTEILNITEKSQN